MLGEPFRRVSKASWMIYKKLLNKLIENTGKKTIIIFGDQEINAKWAAVTLKNKSCCKKAKTLFKSHWCKNQIGKNIQKSKILLGKKEERTNS